MVGMLMREEDGVDILEMSMRLDRETSRIGEELFVSGFYEEAAVSELRYFHTKEYRFFSLSSRDFCIGI